MKSLKTVDATFGPFTSIEVLDDRYRCDTIEMQFNVIGQAEIIDYVAPPPQPRPPEDVQADIVIQTQARLDTFAMTRNYDSILSACTYATSPTVKFKTEGQYAVQARDATWAALYTILAEVQAGTRPMPSGYADIESELPALVWPV